jgi:uncharacterized protein (TIGR02186 family)
LTVRSTFLRCLAVVAAILTFAAGASAEPSADAPCDLAGGAPAKNLSVQPTQVPIGLFYGGAELHVSAELPADMPAVVLIRGDSAPLSVKKKGKVWGVLWMNVGDAAFERVPEVYILASSAPLKDLADEETLDRAGLGYRALARASGGDEALFGEVVKLAESEGLFSVRDDGVKKRSEAGVAHLEASLPISARVPAGKYTVQVVGFENGAPRCLGSTPVTLEQTGLAQSLRTIAYDHGLLYGILAVVVALLAGIATGLVFGKGASKGH